MDKTFYMEMMQTPGAEAWPKTRWWWFGCKVKEGDIVYQLDEMKRAGIGGVELQITYPLQAGDDNYEYFSPDYFRVLRFTSEELKKRGMTLDITLGSSWPFGGPFVPFAKSAVHVVPLELTVQGPCSFSYDFTNRVAGEIVGCVMGRMEGSEMLPETVTDLRGYLTDKLLYNWPWGTKLDNVPIPEGVWKVVVFAASQFREHVLMPTRGAGGYVIDHNNKEAMRFFLEHAGTPLVEKLGRGAVDNFFCDSLEVFGHNWAIGLYDEFKKRRGYDLHPYIYALWGEIKGLTEKVRYDFHRTLSELTVEGFFREMTDWCHEMGSRSRIQAHGTWGDVLLTYAAADFPEGETFSAWDKFSVNTVHRRLATSAGHLYGRPIISNESFTWLRFPRFCETPEQIKIAADSIFMDGINQIVNHGYAYSPEGAEESRESRENETDKESESGKENEANKGDQTDNKNDESVKNRVEPLYFYASSNISHTNTWWKFYPHVSRYIARVSSFLRMGECAARLCIYLPQADVWAENPLSDLHLCMKLEEKIETATVDAIAHRGYWFDYINDDAITDGKLSRYEALVIMETDRMPGKTAQAIRRYAQAGGLVICAGKLPSADCGMAGSFDVAGLFAQMREAGELIFAADKREALLTTLAQNLTPDLSVTEGQGDIGYVHRRVSEDSETADIYFVANMSLRDYETMLCFRESYGTPLILDPLTGQEVELGDTQDGVSFQRLPDEVTREGKDKNCEIVKNGSVKDETVKGKAVSERDTAYGTEIKLYFPAGQSYILVFEGDTLNKAGCNSESSAAGQSCPADKAWVVMESCAVNENVLLDQSVKEKEEEVTGNEAALDVLPPLQRFYQPLPSLPAVREIASAATVIDLSEGWDLAIPALDFSAKLDTLEGFEKIPALRHFSGEAVYTRTFMLANGMDPAHRILLHADDIGCCAHVYVNGEAVTDWIMRPYIADIGPWVRAGENTLTIKVSNLLINRFIDPEKKIYQYPDKLMDQWPYFPQELIKERGKRLDNWRELEMVKEPMPSGLMGRVTLTID